MLDQLVESRGNRQASRRSISFLILFGVAIISVLFFAYLWSLIVKANDSVLSGDDLELSTLVAPVPLPEDAPPPPEKQPEKKQEDLPTRKENIANIMEQPPDVPPKPSTEKLQNKARPIDQQIQISDSDTDNPAAPTRSTGPGVAGGVPGGVPGGTGTEPSTGDEPPPPPPPTKAPVPKIVSKGVINGIAINLPKPAYPPTAKAVGASGSVSVQVTIDESGNVISAVATSGHPLLKPVAAQAARSAKFRPTLLSGVPVKVSGIIVYNFAQ
jgi:protein TonB